MDITRRRLYNQHLSQPDFKTPGEVVRYFGAVQAQDLLGALYAIGLRMMAVTEQTVEAAIADKTIIRTWPMRGTIHFVPPSDVRWMLKLLAHRQNAGAAGMYRKVGLTGEIFAQAGEVLAKALQGGKQATRKELYTALEEAGVATAGEMRGLHILGYWSREGLICLGPRRGKQATFVLLDEWIPEAPLLEGEEALAALAGRYFASHGPATVHDFAWWTGLTIAEARLGIKLVERDFAQETAGTRTYWSAPTTPPDRSAEPDVYLLPAFDEFTVAYKDRSAFLDPTLSKEEALHGIGPSIIIDGRMAGTWKRTLKKNAVIVEPNLFAPINEAETHALDAAAERYGRFLGLPVAKD